MKSHAGQCVRACGLMVADRINAASSGDLMKFVTLADRTGFVETLLFPNVYRRFGHLTLSNPLLAVTGKVEMFENNNGFTLNVESVSSPFSKDHKHL
jgi:DNA polymerase III alpha subunit